VLGFPGLRVRDEEAENREGDRERGIGKMGHEGTE